MGINGLFYGTTGYGALGGTIFSITSTGNLSTLYSFGSLEGVLPTGSLIQVNGGDLYGTTLLGGSGINGGVGTVFTISPSGEFTSLHSFAKTDGAEPGAGLVQGTDGAFYGTTEFGGANSSCEGGCGTVFRITPSGELTSIYSFCSQLYCADGYGPFRA